jgi:uncharacterized membrane protein
MTGSSGDPTEFQQRLERLESQLGEFERELTALRELLSAREEPAETPAPSSAVVREPEPVVVSPHPRPAPETRLVPAPDILEAPIRPARTTELDIEALLSGRVMAWVGGLAILVGSLFFLSLAFSRGWIGPETRVVIGLLAGAAMVAGGAFFFERRERLFGYVLLAVGLGVFNLAMFAATRLYDLIPYQVALAGTFVAAAIGAFIAIRARSQVVASYGLLPALIAPVLFDAEPTGVTISFLAVLLTGTAIIALYRTWTWLPLLSLLFTFFQLYGWLEDSSLAGAGLLVLAGYWLTHALASGGEDVRRLRDQLRPSSTIVAILNTAVAVGGGFILLDDRLDEWRGLYLISLAALHLPIAGYLFYRGGDRHPFGMLTMGLGLAVAAIAIPVQFSGEVVPIAWAAVAVVMVWLYGRLGNWFSLGAGGSFGIFALWHFVLFDYPLDGFLTDVRRSAYPFINGSGAVLGSLLLALAASAYLARKKEVLTAVILLGSGLISYALPYELSDGWLVAGWSLVTLALVAVHRVEPTGHPIYAVAGIALSGFTLLVTLARVATPSRLRVGPGREIDHSPFWSDATLALASLAAALLAAWLLHRKRHAEISGLVLAAATSLVVYLLSVGLVDEFQKRLDAEAGNLSSLREQAQVGLSILWTAFGVTGFVLGIILRRTAMRVYGLALLGIAIVKVFIVDLASLDASYRVISFIALGILLLFASFLYQKLNLRENGSPRPAS